MSYRLWREMKELVPGTEARMAESRVSAVDLQEEEEDEPVLLGHLVVVSYQIPMFSAALNFS
jgi:hypothetical protein